MSWFPKIFRFRSSHIPISDGPEKADEMIQDQADEMGANDPSFLRGAVSKVVKRVREGRQAIRKSDLGTRARSVLTHHLSHAPDTGDTGITRPDPEQVQSRVHDHMIGAFRVRFWLHAVNDEELESCQQDTYEHTIPLAEYSAHLKSFASHVQDKPELQEAMELMSSNLSHAARRAQEIGELCGEIHPKLHDAFCLELGRQGLDPDEELGYSYQQGHFRSQVEAIYHEVLMDAMGLDGTLANEQNLVESLLEKYQAELKDLVIGEQWIFPGGSLHHAVLIGFTKQKDDQIQLDIYNSGYGIGHHDRWGNKRNTCLTKRNVPLDEAMKFLSASLESCLGYSLTEQHKNDDILSIYKAFTRLSGNHILEQDPAFYRSPQKGDTCTKESIDALISNRLISQARDMDASLADAKVDYRDFQLYLKVKALEHVSRHILGGTESAALPRTDQDFRDRYIYPVKKYLQKCEHMDCQDKRIHHPILELARLTILEIADTELPQRDSFD